MKIHSKQHARERGFSLIEIILAIGVFAMTIVAVLGMLGSSSQATSEVINTVSASQIADAVRTELENVDYETDLVNGTSGTSVLELYGRKNGDGVVLKRYAGNDPETGNPPGIAERDRFFLIQVERLGKTGDSLVYRGDDVGTPATDAAQMALSVRVYWPYQVPTGVGPNDAAVVDPTRRSLATFNVSIPRR